MSWVKSQSAQLVLPISINPDASWAHWVSRDVTREVEAVAKQMDSSGSGLFIWGAEGDGKSHLLQACCAQVPASARYVPLSALLDYPPSSVLEQAENDGLLVIDDVHLIDGRSDWQEALFHCFNRCSAQSVPIVAAGRAPPSALTTVLPDLQSRLSLLSVFRLPAWDLGDFEHLLSELLRARGVILSAEVARYLSIRLRRIPKEAVRVAKIIDQASLAEQRSPTIPFLKTLGL